MRYYINNSNNNSNKASGGGVGFVSLLQLCFIVLKLCGKIDWSWFWVLAPTWISILLLVIFVTILIKILKR